MFYWEENIRKQSEQPSRSLLMVLLSIPFNKLPWSWHSFSSPVPNAWHSTFGAKTLQGFTSFGYNSQYRPENRPPFKEFYIQQCFASDKLFSLTHNILVSTLKMGTVIKNMSFSLKKTVKSGLDKREGFCPKSQISIIYTKNNHLPAWRNFKINFLDHFSPSW